MMLLAGELSLESALVGAGSALLGSITGVVATLTIHSRNRKEKRRDEVRAAYIEWMTSLDVRTFRETQQVAIHSELRRITVQPGLSEADRITAAAAIARTQQSNEVASAESVHRESSAFACLLLADGSSEEFKEVDRIRKIAPFMSSNTIDPSTGLYSLDSERFSKLEREQAVALGVLAKRLSGRFSR